MCVLPCISMFHYIINVSNTDILYTRLFLICVFFALLHKPANNLAHSSICPDKFVFWKVRPLTRRANGADTQGANTSHFPVYRKDSKRSKLMSDCFSHYIYTDLYYWFCLKHVFFIQERPGWIFKGLFRDYITSGRIIIISSLIKKNLPYYWSSGTDRNDLEVIFHWLLC